MRVGTCLNERLLLAVIRAPPPLSNHSYRPQNVQTWVRAITTTRCRPERASVISFGEENDAILEKYMQPLKRKPKPKTTKQKSASAEISHPSPPAEDFEISDFVDRSAPKSQPQPAVEAHPQDSSKAISPKAQPKKEPSPGMKRHNEPWQVQKEVLKIKFPEGWKPRKKLSPDAMEGIRGLHEQDPVKYSTAVLAEQFKVSPEAIRRILKSKWMLKQSPEMMQQRRERWAKRHDRIWDAKAELGLRPKRRKDKEVEDPEKFERDMQRREILGEI